MVSLGYLSENKSYSLKAIEEMWNPFLQHQVNHKILTNIY